MGSAGTEAIGSALFSKGRRELLSLLFSHPERSYYLREIVRTLGIGQGAVQRELSRLLDAGLLIRTQKGNQVHYQANRASPVFGELKSLMMKTAGLVDVLRDSLKVVGAEIAVAFVFGSFARSEEHGKSDVDVMVVGRVSFGDVISALQSAQARLAREVNPVVFSEDEFRARSRSEDRFLQDVLGTRRLFVIGGEDELKRLG